MDSDSDVGGVTLTVIVSDNDVGGDIDSDSDVSGVTLTVIVSDANFRFGFLGTPCAKLL